MLRLAATCRAPYLGRFIPSGAGLQARFAAPPRGSRIVRTLLAAAALVATLGCRSSGGGSGQLGPEVLRGLDLTTAEGRRFEVSSLAGQSFLLHFMFTTCPSACPRAVALLDKTRTLLPPELQRRFTVVSISVDPEHDTPEALRAFAVRERVGGSSWHFLRPSPHSLEQLAKRLTVFEPNAPEVPSRHSLTLYLFDTQGRPLQRYNASDTDVSHLARELIALDRVEKSSAPPQLGI
jgi:cytochrome oxidase Cu insertion factor (SCO1/SenC/PrrC family)